MPTIVSGASGGRFIVFFVVSVVCAIEKTAHRSGRSLRGATPSTNRRAAYIEVGHWRMPVNSYKQPSPPHIPPNTSAGIGTSPR
jgi:hypothetical protein